MLTRSAGAIVFLGGLLLALSGGWALGAMYGVSTTVTATLQMRHRLVQRGQYAFVRHPMYLGSWLCLPGASSRTCAPRWETSPWNAILLAVRSAASASRWQNADRPEKRANDHAPVRSIRPMPIGPVLPPKADLALMPRIDKLHLKHRFLGARRLALMLHREAIEVRHCHSRFKIALKGQPVRRRGFLLTSRTQSSVGPQRRKAALGRQYAC